MKKIPLNEFCRLRSQNEAAEIVGCSQSAISQMISSGRQIFITEDDSGAFDCIEIKKPRQKKAA